jgi:hypothetical protein
MLQQTAYWRLGNAKNLHADKLLILIESFGDGRFKGAAADILNLESCI